MKRIFQNIVILSCAIASVFLISEAAIRLFYNRFYNYNMEMFRYMSELKQPLPYAELPFHHFPNKKGKYYGVDIKTNSLGFRDDEYEMEKPKNKKRIIVLGDSTTLGWGVPFTSTYPKQLEVMLGKDKYEVINMGIGNYNSVMEIELFKLKGLNLYPDMVILAYFLNDAEPTPSSKFILEYAIIRHSYFISYLFDRFVKARSRFDKNFNWNEYYRNLYSSTNSANLAADKRALEELASLCSKNNIELLIVNIPELRILNGYPFTFATDFIRNLAQEANVPFLDLLPALVKHKPESLWVSLEDPHPNAKANYLIALELYKKIVSEK